jgi:hypothetical protein
MEHTRYTTNTLTHIRKKEKIHFPSFLLPPRNSLCSHLSFSFSLLPFTNRQFHHQIKPHEKNYTYNQSYFMAQTILGKVLELELVLQRRRRIPIS